MDWSTPWHVLELPGTTEANLSLIVFAWSTLTTMPTKLYHVLNLSTTCGIVVSSSFSPMENFRLIMTIKGQQRGISPVKPMVILFKKGLGKRQH
jgi:hypothetical protein